MVGQSDVDFIPSIRTTDEGEELQAGQGAFSTHTAEIPKALWPLVPSSAATSGLTLCCQM